VGQFEMLDILTLMNLSHFPVGVTDWSQASESVHPGASGTATVRSRQIGDIQLRMVIYSPGYLADHWCNKGYIVFVVAGDLIIEHQHGHTYKLMPGASYHVADGDGPGHRVLTENGATVFIVD
jgi:hypothetical protein